ncbi:MAG: flavodoxin [Bacteroidales bacterium]|nr:flavodoxin [Bacteroidales bacterium]
MSKIALFFGPVGGNVDKVTKMLADTIGHDKVDIIPVVNSKASDVDAYDKVIFLSSAIGLDQWDMVDVKDDWDRFFPELDNVNFANKTVAVLGLGDHIKYPSHFVGSMVTLAEKLIEQGAKLVGEVPTNGYTFDESDALNSNGNFYGLAIDEDNEEELTQERINRWVEQIKPIFGF